MRNAFLNFSAEKLALLSDNDIEQLLQNETIIRNRLKIISVRNNAQCFLRVAQRENIVDYFWQFTQGIVIQNAWKKLAEVPAVTTEATAMAKQLKKTVFLYGAYYLLCIDASSRDG